MGANLKQHLTNWLQWATTTFTGADCFLFFFVTYCTISYCTVFHISIINNIYVHIRAWSNLPLCECTSSSKAVRPAGRKKRGLNAFGEVSERAVCSRCRRRAAAAPNIPVPSTAASWYSAVASGVRTDPTTIATGSSNESHVPGPAPSLGVASYVKTTSLTKPKLMKKSVKNNCLGCITNLGILQYSYNC